MKHLFISLFFLCAVSVNTSAQDVTYDPCKELRIALLSVDRLVVEGKLDSALTKLNKFKNDPEMQNCPEMKEGVVDYKINEIQKKIDDLKPKLQSYKQCPDNNHPHLIDLGLPSGTKWACCNLGAKMPEGYGGYYAWGETEEKKEYTWKTYKHCDGTEYTCHDIGKCISGTQYDVAHVKLGKPWQMPTYEQINELMKCCTSKKVTINGVKGRMMTSNFNGASIFFPPAGGRYVKLYGVGEDFNYWSGSHQSSSQSYSLSWWKNNVLLSATGVARCSGYNVRPVAK